jgi:transcriptional regulator with XRE-family HTH domain
MDIKSDIERFRKETGWSVLKLAAAAGVSKDSIYRLLRGDRRGINSTTLQRLWPFIYGDKRPAAASPTGNAA